MAMTYQRKVDEFNVLLSDYSRETALAQTRLRQLTSELSTERAVAQSEAGKAEILSEDIALAKERVKHLQAAVEAKNQQGEEIYNQLRDYVTLQEERLKVLAEEVTPLKVGEVPTLEAANGEIAEEIESLKNSQSTASSDH